jgi:dipeptidyl-peptidase 4
VIHFAARDSGGATLVGPVTGGEWIVESIAGVDETKGVVYFTGTRDGPLERHLYVAPLVSESKRTTHGARARRDSALAPSGRTALRLTAAPGMHSVKMSHDHRCFVDVFSSLDFPSQTNLYTLPDAYVFPAETPQGGGEKRLTHIQVSTGTEPGNLCSRRVGRTTPSP